LAVVQEHHLLVLMCRQLVGQMQVLAVLVLVEITTLQAARV
jgi:hypothetical protein